MLTTLAMATVLSQGCPKPVKHHHKQEPAAACVIQRNVVVQAAPEEITPAEILVYRYYILLPEQESQPAEPAKPCSPPSAGFFGGGGWFSPTPGRFPGVHMTPEIDPNGLGSAFTLMAGILVIIRHRFRAA